MIEMRRLKNVVTFIQTILSFVLSRKIIISTTILHVNMETFMLYCGTCKPIYTKVFSNSNKMLLNMEEQRTIPF